MQIAWMTKTSISGRPPPTRAPMTAKTRSHRSVDHRQMVPWPRRARTASPRRTRNPTSPTVAVGIPPTADHGLARTFVQLKYASRSHHASDAAAYHCHVRYAAFRTPNAERAATRRSRSPRESVGITTRGDRLVQPFRVRVDASGRGSADRVHADPVPVEAERGRRGGNAG